MAVEEPPFRLVSRAGAFEVRDYPALVVAEVTVGGDQKQAAYRGFRTLAAYIFGGNARGESISMTAPVVQTPFTWSRTVTPAVDTRTIGKWVVRFTMPSRFALNTLPAPKDAGLKLRLAPPSREAVLKFSGLAGKDEVQAKALELGAWITKRRLRPLGPISLAQYDPPWTLWFMRRNEVMIPVAK